MNFARVPGAHKTAISYCYEENKAAILELKNTFLHVTFRFHISYTAQTHLKLIILTM